MEYIWLFFLLFAALAGGWFYLQRAKARPATAVTTSGAPAGVDDPRDATDERSAS